MNRHFKDLLKEFSGARVEYLIVGAHALAFHAEPRYTKDLDIWVNPTPPNARRVYESLARFGAPLAGVTAGDFSTPGIVYQIGMEPVRIDILTAVSGLDFAQAYARRTCTRLEDTELAFISIEDLIANKEAAGRPQDLLDAKVLRQALSRKK